MNTRISDLARPPIRQRYGSTRANSVTSSMQRTIVFISYSHKDRKWLEGSKVHLRPIEEYRQNIEIMDDTRIEPGQRWSQQIQRSLTNPAVAVLLVSANFLASSFITTVELPTFSRAATRNGLVVLPVHIGPCRFDLLPILARTQSVNDPRRPMIDLRPSDRDRVWVRLTEQIDKVHMRKVSG